MVGQVSVHDDDEVACCKLEPMGICGACTQLAQQSLYQFGGCRLDMHMTDPHPAQALQDELPKSAVKEEVSHALQAQPLHKPVGFAAQHVQHTIRLWP